ncbi:MAG TPA: malic enzyme-like NAD(P)-binding protein, partial [Candidatus Sulfotelmatobacter sp.]|nr:malic enzyme-like NAD(P)-binding protein [Candidatus Sulfotelmatobacter sp.]
DAGLSEAEARKNIFAVDKDGLLVEGMPGIRRAQEPFVQSRSAVADWRLKNPSQITLLDVVNNVRPTALIGVSGQAGAFTEDVIRTMAAGVERPIIFPLSNPTSRSEASADDLIAWTEGRALIGTGSPFRSVKWQGRQMAIDQTNNSYIFPGMGLGILAVSARRVTDAMFAAAARCLADLSPSRVNKSGRLLPAVSEIRSVAFEVAKAVAGQAIADGLAMPVDEPGLESRIRDHMWNPDYLPYRYIESMS